MCLIAPIVRKQNFFQITKSVLSISICLLSIISIQSLIGWNWKRTGYFKFLSYTIHSFRIVTYGPGNVIRDFKGFKRKNLSKLSGQNWWLINTLLHDKQRKNKDHTSLKLVVNIHCPPKREFESFWLMTHIPPDDEPIHFGLYVTTAHQNVHFVHEIADIWISIRFHVILMVTQVKPLIVVTPWPVLLPECPHVDVPQKINRQIIMEFSDEFQFPAELIIQFCALYALSSVLRLWLDFKQ